MAKNNTIQIEDQWLELDTPEISKLKVDELVLPSPIRISLEVILPQGKEPPNFNFKKDADVKKFRGLLESRCVDAFKLVVEARKKDQDGDDDGFKEAESALKKLNAFVKKATSDFRVLLRRAVAKAMGDGTKADDLMTIGSMSFKEFEFVPGIFEGEESFDSPLLDISKAVKRKKWQPCAVAWLATGPCFVSIRAKKEYKASELKELRDLIPGGSKKSVIGLVRAKSELYLFFKFPEGDRPRAKILKNGLESQLKKKGMKIDSPIGILEEEDRDVKKEKKKEKGSSEKSSKEASSKPESTKKVETPKRESTKKKSQESPPEKKSAGKKTGK